MGTRFRTRETSTDFPSRPSVAPIERRRSFSPRIPQPLEVASGLMGAAAVLLVVFAINMLLSRGSPTATVTPTVTPTPRAVQPVSVPSSSFPSGLASHACVRYGPLHGNQHHIVFIDPGHGGADAGATGSTTNGKRVYEKDVTLSVALAALPILRGGGYTVVLSRDADTLVTRTTAQDFSHGALTATGEKKDAQGRVACANTVQAQALVLIHLNAYADPTMNGAETVYDSTRPFRQSSQRLATLIQQHVLSQFRSAGWPVPDRGVADDRATGALAPTAGAAAFEHLLEIGPSGTGWLQHPSTMPGALAEPLFITHPEETDVAIDPKGVHAMAAGLSDAIDEYFSGGAAEATATP